MIVAIQQPEHAPWMGFFHKMVHCDHFVYLDNVQFKKRYFENRNRIHGQQHPQWVTVPVQTKGRYHQRIDEVMIDGERSWVRKYQGSVRQAYSHAPHWADLKDIVWPCLDSKPIHLVALNLAIIDATRDYLSITTPASRASEMGLSPLTGEDLILAICTKLRADTYLSGPDGRNYLNADSFVTRGIHLTYHDFQHPTYTQLQGGFTSHLSIFDLIANHGRDGGDILRGHHMAEATG